MSSALAEQAGVARDAVGLGQGLTTARQRLEEDQNLREALDSALERTRRDIGEHELRRHLVQLHHDPQSLVPARHDEAARRTLGELIAEFPDGEGPAPSSAPPASNGRFHAAQANNGEGTNARVARRIQ